jgi:hypothetical protein
MRLYALALGLHIAVEQAVRALARLADEPAPGKGPHG